MISAGLFFKLFLKFVLHIAFMMFFYHLILYQFSKSSQWFSVCLVAGMCWLFDR